MHKVVFWSGPNELAELPWPHDLESAANYARNNMMVYNATHAEVIDTSTRKVIVTYLATSPRKQKSGEPRRNC